MPLYENLIFSSVISDAQYILLHNDIILSLVISTLNNPGVLLSYFASVNDLPSTLNVGCNSLLSLGPLLSLGVLEESYIYPFHIPLSYVV